MKDGRSRVNKGAETWTQQFLGLGVFFAESDFDKWNFMKMHNNCGESMGQKEGNEPTDLGDLLGWAVQRNLVDWDTRRNTGEKFPTETNMES